MDRLACINVPSLPLQIALRRFPRPLDRPVVLVAEDRPSSPILQLNQIARNLGLRPGMRYSEGLSLVRHLKAVLVAPRDLALACEEIYGILEGWSPQIEPCPWERGSFWVNTSGLATLYGSEAQWGAGVRQALADQRYHAHVVVGYSRGGTYVVAKARRRSTVIKTWEGEHRAWASAPLSLFPLSPRNRRLLERLGISTLAALAKLSSEELSRRFGPEVVQELRRWQRSADLPLQTTERKEPWTRTLRCEVPLVDHRDLVDRLKAPLHEALELLKKQGRLLTEVRSVFVLEDATLVTEVVRPAEPTTDLVTLTRLLDLRLSQTVLTTGVQEIRLSITDQANQAPSGELFRIAPVRDVALGALAFSWIRALWGDGSVVRPVLVDSHLPERSYRWQEIDRPLLPRAAQIQPGAPTAVRRVPWDLSTPGANPAGARLGGPFRLRVVSGTHLVDRDYWFLRTSQGEVAWVSWDRLAQTPRWEGVVD